MAVGVKVTSIAQLVCGCNEIMQLLSSEKSPGLAPCTEICGEIGTTVLMSASVIGIVGLDVPTITLPKSTFVTETVTAVLGVGKNVMGTGVQTANVEQRLFAGMA